MRAGCLLVGSLFLRGAHGVHAARSTRPRTAISCVHIDRESFARSVRLLGVSVDQASASLLRRLAGKYVLRHRRVKGVQPDTDDIGRRVILLDDSVSFEALNQPEVLPAPLRLAIEQTGGMLRECSVDYTYDDLTAAQVMLELLPEGVEVPTSFETVGHLVHLNLRPEQLPYKEVIGQVLLDKLRPRVRTVVNKRGEISSTFRNLPLELIAGDEQYEVEVQHGAVKLRFDYSKVYWNSRLHTEHERLAASFARGQLVWDMFAGVGPFAVLAARRGVYVLANDLNPASSEAIISNAWANKVAAKVAAYNLDAAEFVRRALRAAEGVPPREGLGGVRLEYYQASAEQAEGLAAIATAMEARPPDHIIMNLPAESIRFVAPLRQLKPPMELGEWSPPSVHCYSFSKCATPEAQLDEAHELLGAALGWVPDVHIRIVRTVAPNKMMLCYTFSLMPPHP